jgi:hypothetical protein
MLSFAVYNHLPKKYILTITANENGGDDINHIAGQLNKLKFSFQQYEEVAQTADGRKICSFRKDLRKAEVAIKFLDKSVNNYALHLVVKILTSWGYNCEVKRNGLDIFEERILATPRVPLFYEGDIQTMRYGY